MKIDYLIDIEKINQSYLTRILKSVVKSDNYKLGKSFVQTLRFNVQDIGDAVESFFNDEFHGIKHSLKIWERCLEIAEFIKYDASSRDYELINDLLVPLKWACIFHDLSLFFGANQKNHAKYSAMIVQDVFETNINRKNYLKEDIILCIEKHDWVNERINGKASTSLKTNPVVDLFRLACKTCLNSSEKIERYYMLSKRNNLPFYDTHTQLRDRVFNPVASDTVNNFILSFCIDDCSFFFTSSVFAFRQWRDKDNIKNAKNLVLNYCREEKLPEKDIEDISYILSAV